MVSMSVDQIVSLVESLYTAHSPDAVAELQNRLQILQKSEQGWEIAEMLLAQPSLNCQFIGALTYTVNLNLHSATLASSSSTITYATIMTKLLSHLRDVVREDPNLKSRMLIITKLLANLALIFTRTFQDWKDPLNSVVSYLTNQPETTLNSEILQTLHHKLIEILLLFSQITVEDITKKDASDVNRVELHRCIHEGFFATTQTIMAFAVERYEEALASTWLDCMSSWIQYISVAQLESTERYDASVMLSNLFKLLVDSKGEARVITVVTDIFDTNPGMMKQELNKTLESLLFGSWGIEYLNTHGHDHEAVNMFSRLVIRFLEGNLVSLSASLYDDQSNEKFEFLISLSSFPGTPIIDEMNSVDFVDFWSQMAECFVSDGEYFSLLLKNDESSMARLTDKSIALFSRVAQIYWQKVHIPDDVADFKEEFDSFRRDVADFFETIYSIVEFPLFDNLVKSIIEGLTTSSSLSDLEASLFLMNAVSANFSEHTISDDVLKSLVMVMDSDLLKVVQQSISFGQSLQYPILTTVQFLASIDYFYRHSVGVPYLSTILNFLFGCMLNSNQYSLVASKAISKICNECRQYLVDFIPYFDDLLTEMISNYNVEPLIRQRIINSHASIVQSIKDPEIQSHHLKKILTLIRQRSLEAIREFDNPQLPREEREKQLAYLISLLSSVKEIGRGMKLPDDVDQIYNASEIGVIKEFWERDPMGIHQIVIDTVGAFALESRMLSKSLRITEEACNILQSGMSESIGGPFVFENNVPLNFIQARCSNKEADPKSFLDTLPLLFSLLSALFNSAFRTLDQKPVEEILQLLLIDNMVIVKSDPDILQSALSAVTTLVEKRPSLLVHLPLFFDSILPFALDQLKSKERYVLKATEKFWVRLIALRRGGQQDTISVQRMFLETPLGEVLLLTALENMLESPRSNVDLYIEVIKVIVVKYQRMVKQWMTASFVKIDQLRQERGKQPVPSSAVFISKVLVTRGMGGCNRVINDLWLQVNGLVDYNTR
ncbi:unnamed protein product [Kuraishia capsulata CBS 1993]|uniref:Exportin-1/Importin-beta-like domain-containing protein n=1 Tax=Kuraishia capsulata CBS 1993 TaxID=1382522 RepID=W6MWC5_9ASCO|nr:uncharacterized protein KUCA_T00003182001 [Kuraishia capsulata CBS 1993]CDK27205.1 unnamed protein product [Kuraishia capsulata CBS 1993]